MKNHMLILLMILLTFCGGPQGPAPVSTTAGPDIAFGPLNENEVQRFIKVLPTFIEIVKKEGKDSYLDAGPRDIFNAFQQMNTLDKQISALDAKLRAAGMAWSEFWPVYAKTMVAYTAIHYDSIKAELKKGQAETQTQIKEFERMLKDPNVPQAQKELLKQSLEAYKTSQEIYSQADTFYAKVPAANKEIVKKYFPTISNILERD